MHEYRVDPGFPNGRLLTARFLRVDLLDRLTHHVHILELNGESYRLAHRKKARRPADAAAAS